jgi:REase_AHJR-like
MNDETLSRDAEVVERLRRSYVSKGYKFISEPRGDDVPAFLANRYPDAIALSKKDNVVLEIRSSESEGSKSALVKFLATEVPKHEGWRFELVIDDQNSKHSDLNAEPTLEIIDGEIAKVEALLLSGDLKLGIVAGWAILEALTRKLVFVDRSATPLRYKPMSVIEGLVSDGFISDTAGDNLIEISGKRNQLVHGFTQIEIARPELEFLLEIVRELKVVANENE